MFKGASNLLGSWVHVIYLFLFINSLCCSFQGVEGVNRTSLDFGWKFQNNALSSCTATSATFPNSLNNLRCYGFLSAPTASTPTACAQACCNQASLCQAWQFCSNSSCNQASPCWIGTYTNCDTWTGAGWVGGSRGAVYVPTAGTACSLSQCLNSTDDESWRTVTTPHDYIIEGTFDPNADNSHGSLPKSQAWYRRHITIPSSAQGKTIWIDFDGVYRGSIIFFNNQYLGSHASGYTSFRFFLPQNQILWGKDNLLAVYVDATVSEGWWYEGGGIYRHTWLNIADPLHVSPWGVYAPSYVTGPIYDSGSGQATSEAVVKVQTTVQNDYGTYTDFLLTTAVMQGTAMLAQVSSQATLRGSSNITIPQSVTIVGNINLWSPNSPALYSLITTVYKLVGNVSSVVDSVNTTIGIRTVVFDTTQGLFLNNRPFKINGVCNHQDFAGVGVAVPDRINMFRVQKLKQMGVNGWRMSHNPPNPELLDFTDQFGLVVMDENRNFADWGQYYQDFSDMVLRDRNHPSVIMWSVCNEGGCMSGLADGARVGANFKSFSVALDSSRPFTAAMNSDWGVGVSTVLDVQGINYNFDQYTTFHYGHMSQPLFGSETGSCTGARGVYITNSTIAHESIYDADYCARVWVTAVSTAPWVAGGFAWTGFDYKGEPLPYQWPAINSNFGIFDIAGFEKDTYYYYLGEWTTQTVLHLVPQNWNIWYTGQVLEIFVYSNAPFVEVFLNGKSYGVQPIPAYSRGLWWIPYAAGTLSAVAYNTNMSIIASQYVQTTGAPSYLKLSADTATTISANGQDVALLRVTVYDNSGLMVPTASNNITFSVSGPGTVLGVGNGDPSDHSPDKASYRLAFNGLARVIIQSTMQPGTITVTASSPGITSSTFSLVSSL